MRIAKCRTAQVAPSVVALALLGAIVATPAAAALRHHRPAHFHAVRRIHKVRRIHEAEVRPLTVTRPYRRDPFHGPAAIITAPVTIAGMVVSLPFRALGVVFPAQGDPRANPLVVIGAPLHAAGQIAQFPFYAVDTAFGAAPAYD